MSDSDSFDNAVHLGEREREQVYKEMDALRAERDAEKARCSTLEKTLNGARLDSAFVKDDNIKCKQLTGISWDVFFDCFHFSFYFHARTWPHWRHY